MIPLFSLVSQRERETMKDKRTHYGTVDKSEQQICGSTVIFCIVRNTGPMFPPLVGLMAGRQADKIRVYFKFLKIL